MYVNNNMSTYEIAKEVGTYPNKIRRVLIKNKVEIKGKSEAQKNAIKKGVAKIPTKGKPRSNEEKIKISSSLKRYWKEMPEEKYEDYVSRAKKRWLEISEEDKRNMQRLAIKAIQKAGKEGSKLEKFLYEEFVAAGFKVKVHQKHIIPNENLEVDMYFPEEKCIIEIDGPSHFLPIWGEEKLMKQMKADSNKTGLILSRGFAIIRVKHMSDSLPLSDKEELKNKLVDIVSQIKNKFPPKSRRYIELEI